VEPRAVVFAVASRWPAAQGVNRYLRQKPASRMKTIFRWLALFADSLVWVIGCFAIINYASVRFPMGFSTAVLIFTPLFGALFLWRILVKPFLEGYKGT
jgi:hypothetical protein